VLNRQHYSSRLQVRPDDLDLFRHVHSSRYIDYVLAARFEQMRDGYGFPMEEFMAAGFGWVVRHCELEFMRPLIMGDQMEVETWLEELESDTARVNFIIYKLPARKVSCRGWFRYTLVSLESGRAVRIPEWVIARYSLPDVPQVSED